MKCTNQYKKFTIRNLYKTLEEIMAYNPDINMDTEIIISDVNMSNFKQEIKVYPTKDYRDRQVKVGLYINPYEKDEILQDIEEQEQKEKANSKVVQAMTEEPTQNLQEEPIQAIQEETPIGLSWINKYTRS